VQDPTVGTLLSFDVLYYSFIGVLLLVFASLMNLVIRSLSPGGALARRFSDAVLNICLAVFFITNLYFVLIFFYNTLLTTHRGLVSSLTNPIFILFAMTWGIAFYWLKRWHQALYGTIELFAAFSAISVAILKTDEPLVKFFALVGGIYILVRALDNIGNGLPDRLKQHWDLIFSPPKPPERPPQR
jgi:hypothetical protein